VFATDGLTGRFVTRKGLLSGMLPAQSSPEPTPRPSRVIAEALVQRHGPRRIAIRAAKLGFSVALTEAIVVACSAAAIDPFLLPQRASTPAR
jgi:hypothetical protein